MRRDVIIVAAGSIALAVTACQREQEPVAETSPAANSVAVAGMPKAAATGASAACAPEPGLERSFNFPAVDFAKLEANFKAAYSQACGEKLLAGEPLVPAGVPHPGKLFAANAPDSNVAAIYRGGDDGRGDMMLEYHFLGTDGSRSMPSVDDLHEAIFCAVHGASAQEQDDSGRCLAD
jgi:hypothetical protein